MEQNRNGSILRLARYRWTDVSRNLGNDITYNVNFLPRHDAQ